jgi:hypothetical protein
MAIEQDHVESIHGITVPGAYIKLCFVAWSDVDKILKAQFSVWATPTAEKEGKECIEIITIEIPHMWEDIQAACYMELKKLSEYANSKDV